MSMNQFEIEETEKIDGKALGKEASAATILAACLYQMNL